MTVTPSSDVLVLLSGGLDSTACIAFYKQQFLTVRGCFVDYGQVSAEREQMAARAIAEYYGISLIQAQYLGTRPKEGGVISGRNAFLIFLALLEGEIDCGLLSLGIHAGTDYWDCTPIFVELTQKLLDGYSEGRIKLALPFLTWNKRDIWDFCRISEVPIEMTYSCELGQEQPCDRCSSCEDWRQLRAS